MYSNHAYDIWGNKRYYSPHFFESATLLIGGIVKTAYYLMRHIAPHLPLLAGGYMALNASLLISDCWLCKLVAFVIGLGVQTCIYFVWKGVFMALKTQRNPWFVGVGALLAVAMILDAGYMLNDCLLYVGIAGKGGYVLAAMAFPLTVLEWRVFSENEADQATLMYLGKALVAYAKR